MAKKKLRVLQIDMFDEICKEDLSPNQYYLLCCLHEQVTPKKVNTNLDIRHLKAAGWLTREGLLTHKAIELVSRIEKLYTMSKKLTASKLMGVRYKEKILQYNEIFPNIRLPSGKAARSAIGNVESSFKWFFEHHRYTWDTIFKATRVYLDEQALKNFKYCRTSQYFIRKNNISDLADLCHALETGGDIRQSDNNHSIKVV